MEITLPPWIEYGARVQYTHGQTTYQDRLGYLHKNKPMVTCSKNRHCSIIKEFPSQDFLCNYHKLINDSIIQLDWNSQAIVKVNYVSAKGLINPTPSSLKLANSPSNTDSSICLNSYNEEYQAIQSPNI